MARWIRGTVEEWTQLNFMSDGLNDTGFAERQKSATRRNHGFNACLGINDLIFCVCTSI